MVDSLVELRYYDHSFTLHLCQPVALSVCGQTRMERFCRNLQVQELTRGVSSE